MMMLVMLAMTMVLTREVDQAQANTGSGDYDNNIAHLCTCKCANTAPRQFRALTLTVGMCTP